MGANGQAKAPRAKTVDELSRQSLGTTTLWVRAPNLSRARDAMRRFEHLPTLELELDDFAGVDSDTLDGRTLDRAVVRSSSDARTLLALDATFEVVVELTRETAPWLLTLESPSPRLVIRQPTYERLTEAAEHDVDLREFFERFSRIVPVEDVPACISGRPPRERPRVLDASMMDETGRLEIFRYTRRYILDHYKTKSLRCKSCTHFEACDGMHVNFVRAHGYSTMQPILAVPG